MKVGSIKILGKKYDKEGLFTAILFVSPLLLGVLFFYLIPMVQNVFYSFTKWNQFGGYTFIGLENFKKLFSDVAVFQATKNTLTYAIFTVPIGVAISIVIATLLNNKIRGVSLYRVIYFLPAVTMTSAVAMIWKWMFNSEYGIINQVLLKIGIVGPNWLTDSKWAMISLIVVGVWSSLGTSIVLYLAGLQGIPRSFYEAADMDGASSIRKFFSITLPLLTPTVFFNLITSLISALQVYDLIFLMYSETNPALKSVQSLSYLFYRNAFVFNDKGYAAAISVVLLAITLLITVVNFRLQKKWVHY
ncbi:sugar ABC transporter permease [Vagococcus fluvialis]|uniref:carbohydrate ABC transporter permease n=1 Tax=Vagococcus fluvialis TaxID=2738 RepID=UPI001432E667|nr:sugar ABC transporter permease [Vagococcus fluvialis]NKC59283.1 sugar ABC transporter permease [Vagococcus fluvialis]NKD50321.1 sugar ABC transporter permease [Vagococcus fluvialis]